MTSTTVTPLGHWAGGAAFEGTSSRTADVTNPATGQVTGHVALASEEDAQHVIAAASAAAKGWRETSLARRTQVMFAFRELLNSRKGELAELITAEHQSQQPHDQQDGCAQRARAAQAAEPTTGRTTEKAHR